MALAVPDRMIGQLADLAAGGREEVDRVRPSQVVADLEDEPPVVGREVHDAYRPRHAHRLGFFAGLDVAINNAVLAALGGTGAVGCPDVATIELSRLE